MHCDPEEGQTCNSRVVYTGARNTDVYKSKPNSFDLFLVKRVWRQIIFSYHNLCFCNDICKCFDEGRPIFEWQMNLTISGIVFSNVFGTNMMNADVFNNIAGSHSVDTTKSVHHQVHTQ